MKTYGGNVESERVMDVRQFCKLYRDITRQLRHTHSVTDEDWEKVDCDGEVHVGYFMFDLSNIFCSHVTGLNVVYHFTECGPAKPGEHLSVKPQFSKDPVCCEKYS